MLDGRVVWVGAYKHYLAAKEKNSLLLVRNNGLFQQLEGTHHTGLKETFVDEVCAAKGSNSGKAFGLESHRTEIGCGIGEGDKSPTSCPACNCSSNGVGGLSLHVGVCAAQAEAKVPEIIIRICQANALVRVGIRVQNGQGSVVITNVGNSRLIESCQLVGLRDGDDGKTSTEKLSSVLSKLGPVLVRCGVHLIGHGVFLQDHSGGRVDDHGFEPRHIRTPVVTVCHAVVRTVVNRVLVGGAVVRAIGGKVVGVVTYSGGNNVIFRGAHHVGIDLPTEEAGESFLNLGVESIQLLNGSILEQTETVMRVTPQFIVRQQLSGYSVTQRDVVGINV